MNCTQTDNDDAADDVANDNDNDNDDDDQQQQQQQLLSNLPASSMSAISWASLHKWQQRPEP